jgi:hypothetical protein
VLVTRPWQSSHRKPQAGAYPRQVHPQYAALAEAAEIADRLEAAGLDDVAASVRRAVRAAKTDPALAESILREAADDLMARSLIYSHGMRVS